MPALENTLLDLPATGRHLVLRSLLVHGVCRTPMRRFRKIGCCGWSVKMVAWFTCRVAVEMCSVSWVWAGEMDRCDSFRRLSARRIQVCSWRARRPSGLLQAPLRGGWVPGVSALLHIADGGRVALTQFRPLSSGSRSVVKIGRHEASEVSPRSPTLIGALPSCAGDAHHP